MDAMTASLYFISTETFVFDSAGRLIKAWFFCEGCGRAFETKREALECCSQKAAVPKYFVCMKCSSVFTRPDAFEAHRELGCLRVANEAVNDIERHVCLSCGSTLTSKTALESHLRWHETGAPQKVVFKQGEQVIGAIITSGKPCLRFVSEALIGEGQAVCDRCGRVTSVDKIITIFTSTIGTKLDLCKACAREVIK
jgi:hypothetical protein